MCTLMAPAQLLQCPSDAESGRLSYDKVGDERDVSVESSEKRMTLHYGSVEAKVLTAMLAISRQQY